MDIQQLRSHAMLRLELQQWTMEEKEYFSYYRKAGNEVVTEVSELLQSSKKFRISRKIIAGSMGKNTALGIRSEPDFDAVFFVNDVIPPLTSIAEAFADILRHANIENTGQFLNIRTTRFSVQFSVDKILQLPTGPKDVQLNFNMLPAANFTNDYDLVEQERQTLEKIRKTKYPKKDWYVYSAGLTEPTVSSVKNLSEFEHDLITLAKMWDKKLKAVMNEEKQGSSKLSGRSSIIELIATSAAKERPVYGNMLQGLRRFLNLVRRFETLNIDFYPLDDGVFRSESRPLIRDAVNPFNNYASAVGQNNLQHYKLWACATRKCLNRAAYSCSEDEFDKNLEILKTKYFTVE